MTMRKTCPNCNGILELHKDRYVCESCGSSFAVDHDIQDVRRVREETAAEREAAWKTRVQEVNSTRQELDRKSRENDAKRARFSNKSTVIICAIVISVPMLILYTMGYMLQFSGLFLKNVGSKEPSDISETDEDGENAARVPVDASLIEADTEAMQKLYESAEYEMKYYNSGKLVFGDPEITAMSTGEYTLEDVFVLSMEQVDNIYFVYNAVFEDVETGERYDICCPVYFIIHKDKDCENGYRLDYSPHTREVYDKEKDISVYDRESFDRIIVGKGNVIGKTDIDFSNS